MSTRYQELWTDAPLTDIIPAYIYKQYQDDENILAFADGINSLSQEYLDWFNQTPMGVYTNSNVAGALLDWVGNNLYGLFRPTISTSSITSSGELGTNTLGTHTIGTLTVTNSGTAQVANDDIYKRLMTWFLYRGDGVQMSVEWVRRRVARFIYGAYGADIDVGLITNVGIALPTDSTTLGSTNSFAVNTQAVNTSVPITITQSHALVITVPNIAMGNTFQTLFNGNYLPLPFQVNFKVVLV